MLTHKRTPTTTTTMRAVRLQTDRGPSGLALEEVETPRPGRGEALVRVHGAGITRDELTWPTDRLPAIPSYELSGVVVALGPDVDGVSVGDGVYALTPFDRDGVAAEYAAIPDRVLARKPAQLGHIGCAAIPLAALSAWQGLFDHGGLESGQRVLVHGAAGGVGHFAVQLARWRGAHVIGTASPAGMASVRELGADETVDRTRERLEDAIEPVDLVFDTIGGELLAGSAAPVRPGGRVVSVAERPPAGVDAVFFIVEPNREQLMVLARLVDDGQLRPSIDSAFPLSEAKAAFERVEAPGKRGKVVLEVAGD